MKIILLTYYPNNYEVNKNTLLTMALRMLGVGIRNLSFRNQTITPKCSNHLKYSCDSLLKVETIEIKPNIRFVSFMNRSNIT